MGLFIFMSDKALHVCVVIVWHAEALACITRSSAQHTGEKGLEDFSQIWNILVNLILGINGWVIPCEVVLRLMSQDLTDDDQSTSVWVMAWCHQATSHNLSQCWPSSSSPYGISKPEWVKGIQGIKDEHIGAYWCIWPHGCGSTLAQVMAWHQAITWVHVDLTSKVFCVIHLWALLSQKILKTSILDMSLKITNLRLQPHRPWAMPMSQLIVA